MSALWPLQVALVARLKATAVVTALVGTRIYDGQAPSGAAFPYLVIGEGTGEPADAFGHAGTLDTLTLHVFSRYNGRKEALAVVEAMNAALVAPLALDGWGTARLRRDLVTTLVEEDANEGVRHVAARYRIFAFTQV